MFQTKAVDTKLDSLHAPNWDPAGFFGSVSSKAWIDSLKDSLNINVTNWH